MWEGGSREFHRLLVTVVEQEGLMWETKTRVQVDGILV